jgi:hypothetical protein
MPAKNIACRHGLGIALAADSEALECLYANCR